MPHRRSDVVLVVAFLLALAGPLATANFTPVLSAAAAADQDWAVPGMDGWDRWRRGFGHEFGGRAALLALEHRLKLSVGMAPTDEVVLGQDGWLFLGRYHGYDGLADYLHTDPLTPATTEEWLHHFKAKQDALAARGIAYCLVFAPNKPTVYPDLLPSGLLPATTPSRLESLTARLREAGLDVVDTVLPLQQHKSQEPVYYRTDTHWNWGGATAAYLSIAAHLHWPPILPHRIGAELGFEGNLAVISGTPQAFPEGDSDPLYSLDSPEPDTPLQWSRRHGQDALHPTPHTWVEEAVLRVERPAAPLDRGLLIGDSFLRYGFGALVCQHFKHSERVFSHTLDLDQVDRLHPQIVIEEMVEEDLSLPVMPAL